MNIAEYMNDLALGDHGSSKSLINKHAWSLFAHALETMNTSQSFKSTSVPIFTLYFLQSIQAAETSKRHETKASDNKGELKFRISKKLTNGPKQSKG
jgi:hypothetical protein